MNKLNISQLEEGQRYSESVFIDEDNLLIPAEAPLRKKDIDFLKSLGVTEVYTDGFLLVGTSAPAEAFVFNSAPAIKQPDTETVKPSASIKLAPNIKTATQTAAPAILRSENTPPSVQDAPAVKNAVYGKIETLIKQLYQIFKEVSGHAGKNQAAVNTFVRQLTAISSETFRVAKEGKSKCLDFILSGALSNFYLAKSAVNTAILSIFVMQELKFDARKIPEVVVGALLHDVGMLRLPAEILRKKTALSPEEAGIMRSHTNISYQIITKELSCTPAVAIIALQHHERWDGTGYPRRLVGNAIDMGAHIVSVADSFEAMICSKPYRASLTGYMAMKNLVSETAAHFSPSVLQTFVKIIGMYPIGSGVTLNDGRIAKIVDVKPEAPLRPTVKIIAEKGARKLEDGEVIDLLVQKQFYITQALDISSF
ncbi:MAG: HD-GYP domain-containing protein [Spirochaetaceae bacterium]|nr:HD-GYP domain-containing protein [Spirochaetaceae bacterium]